MVPGPSAGRWDVRRRLAMVAGAAVLLVSAILAATGALRGFVFIVPGLLVLAALVAWVTFGARASAAMRAEKAAGYSTIYDFAGYELRDPRTLELLRARDVPPVGTIRRSLIAGMIGVKPGTIVARRLNDEH